MSITRTDPMAAHRAAQQLRDLLFASGRMSPDTAERAADAVTGFHAVHFERRVNEHGVAVRNVVLRGPEEVDPNPPADVLAEVRERLVVRQPETVGASA